MVEFIFGRSGYGKTEYVFNKIKELALSGRENILLITPEQYSLIAERRLLTDLGDDNIFRVNNGSFSRINDDVSRIYGADELPVLSKGGKSIIMMQAIEKCKDELLLFNKKLDTLSFVSSMLSIYDEMKSCNLSGDEVYTLSRDIDNEILNRKLSDISTIMKSYESIIDGKYLDPSEEIKRLYDKLCGTDYFKGRAVFIDGFNGFVAQEYKLLELIIRDAESVTITLCTDNCEINDNFNIFNYVNNSARILKKIAMKADVAVSERVLDTNFRNNSPELKAIEKQILSDKITDVVSSNGDCSVYCAKSISDECSNTAREIRKLLRQGYRASDVTVITRDLNAYADELSYAFAKYEVPFFRDERQPITTQPLVVMIKYLLRAIIFSLKSDDILSLAKTGLTDIPDEDINELENYIYIWNVNGSKWTKPFENSTRGFVSEMNEDDKQALEKINATREKLITPILYLKKAAKTKSAEKICEAIYNTLIILKADEGVKRNAINLADKGFNSLATEQGRVWELVMEILNELAVTVKEEITLKEFYKLFELITSTEDLGVLPSGIDNVTIGQADRIRTDNPKFVFILGANEGVFPKESVGGGLLSENERRVMLENDFKLYSYGEILNVQEKYFAYMACCAPSQKLYVSYIGDDSDASQSEIITDINNIIPDIKIKNESELFDIDLIETRQNAFELMSERYFYNDTFHSSLKEYFADDKRFAAVKSIAENDDNCIKDSKISTSLFGKNMYLSASKVDDYYMCPFRYFCKFGLKATPRQKAEINPMSAGTFIHYVLEMILSQVGTKKLSALGEDEIRQLVDEYTARYLESEMGNLSELPNRFEYNFKRLSKSIYDVVIHLAEEFTECDFETKACELSIDRDGAVKPEIITLDNGGTIQIRGSIDRVDVFEDNGEQYVRVVDYKSGFKKFHLCDVLAGLNLQMFIYLFSLCSDKDADLSGVPSGVLYMHAMRETYPFDSRKDVDNELSSKEYSSFKMDGIVLEDDGNRIAIAMENNLEGKYIPVKLRANGTLSGHLATLEEIGLLHKKVNSLIEEMGNELQKGNIIQSPVKNTYHNTTCDYCDYRDVCSNKRIITNRIAPEYKDDEVKRILRKENADDATVDCKSE